MSDTIVTPIGQLNYLWLAQKTKYSNADKDIYQVTIYIDNGNKEFLKSLEFDIKEISGKHFTNPKFRSPLSPCTHPDFPNHHQLIMKYKVDAGKPMKLMMRDAAGKETEVEKFYNGCFARAQINLHCYNSKNVGVTAYIKGLQFAKDGAEIESHTPVDEFDAVVSEYDELADIA